MKEQLNLIKRRECGDCCLCCKVMGVVELNKPAGKWCDLVQIGTGCGSYVTRPASCAGFECLWLQGILPEDMKPNKVKVVVSTTEQNDTLIVFCDNGQPPAGSRAEQFIEHAIAKDLTVILVMGKHRKILGKAGVVGQWIGTVCPSIETLTIDDDGQTRVEVELAKREVR